jgi:glyceraldehyde-3-phosphate dehydrogenase/erythrose-4-phosphate dehydrogenase
VKVMTWYDNEWGFTNQMVQVAVQLLGSDVPAGASSR